jgi:rod shape-determining protein MreC
MYFSLVKENKALAEENARLYNLLPAVYFNPLSEYKPDTSASRRYAFIPARVINNSVNKQYNFITLNVGSREGVAPGMAVICDQGIVGEVKEATENFSSVISVLNRESFPNAMIKRNGYFGPIKWPGRNYRKVVLTQIPAHVDVHVGDTVVTSGYSYTYPKGIFIGIVESFELEEGISYEITVNLNPDFKNLSNVLVVKNLMRDEQIGVERSQEND